MGVGLYDAENAFQKLNRYLMLWNADYLWNKASRFLFNRYRHFNLVYVRREPGQPPIPIQCQEGIAQGCVLAMQTYGIALLPLCRRMRADIPEALQLWYADDASSVGSAEANARCLEYLVEHGPWYGYIPKPEKSWYICKSQDEEEARRAFDARGLTIGYSRGQRYLGGFVGNDATKTAWLEESCEKWAAAVSTLAKVAVKWPQTAYAGLNFVLQNQWQYAQRVVMDTGAFFDPVERALREEFIPALLGMPKEDITGRFREILNQSIKKGGLGIRNPVDTAGLVHATSNEASEYLVQTMVEGKPFEIRNHNSFVTAACQEARATRLEREQEYLELWAEGNPAELRRMRRAGKTGVYLTAFPNRDNGTVLSADEFRDNARLRYNLAPLDMPQHCDGCSSKMTVEHALSCRVGGLVHIRHDDVADEFRSLCCQAFSPGRVQREPRIHSGVSRRVRVEAAAEDATISAANTNNHGSRDPTTTPPTQQQRQQPQQQQRQKQRQRQPHTKTPVSEERGDASCYGFWDRGREAIFDVRITDTEARFHRNKDPEKVLAQQGKEKKDKYLHV